MATAPITQKRARARKSIAHLPTATEVAARMEDKENATVDIASAMASNFMAGTTASSAKKKSRSKSLGPGGLEALSDTAGNKRKPPPFLLKSILKPTIPLSPLKAIPTRKTGNVGKAPESPSKTITADDRPAHENASPSPQKADGNAGEDSTTTLVSPVRGKSSSKDTTASTSQNVETTHEDQRAARRKSLAARRVSFAPEATLHTWNIEYMQDATTSSTSNDSTRRASSIANHDAPAIVEGPQNVTKEQSPVRDRQGQQKKRRRRSSIVPPMGFGDLAEASSSESHGTDPVDRDGDQMIALQSLDVSSGSASSSGNATYEYNKNSENDVDGDATMELANDEILAGFAPLGQHIPQAAPFKALVYPDLENMDPFASVVNFDTAPKNMGEDEDASMDVTTAVGTIIGMHKGPDSPIQNSRVQYSNATPQQDSMADASSLSDDETMDLTVAAGTIKSGQNDEVTTYSADENEDLSMEFTSIFGGIKGRAQSMMPHEVANHTIPDNDVTMDGQMDITTAFGGIVQNKLNDDSAPDDQTAAMDMTMAVGGIVKDNSVEPPPTASAQPSSRRSSLHSQNRNTVRASIAGSPTLSPSHPKDRNGSNIQIMDLPSPEFKRSTPIKLATPTSGQHSTTKKPSSNAGTPRRTVSPKRLFQEEINQAGISSPISRTPKLFSVNHKDGSTTPSIVFAPPMRSNRRTSGVGLDKDGLGSPRVAALLDKRTSIGDSASTFSPFTAPKTRIRFEDPQEIGAQVLKERDEDERRESGRFIMEQEINQDTEEKDVTTNLKDLIGSMTPKRNKVKGRKSLAVGAAKGVLGKRPAELDEDYDDDGTPEGLRGRESSPVKRIRLQGPPSMTETTGRPTRVFRPSLGRVDGNIRPFTPTTSSPSPQKTASTPKNQGRFTDAVALSSAQKPMPSFNQQGKPLEMEKITAGEGDDKIQLQDFLNMTSIRFMELNTTKRRHTVAPGSATRRKATDDSDQSNNSDSQRFFEECVVAGACTVPMLELYQHSCRELRKYIAEGRNIVREIEADTFEENPPLFREYMSAAPSKRQIMDNQFKNMKTNARLLSKGMWYEWRMKLLDGLRQGLDNISTGMIEDAQFLTDQEEALGSVLPAALEERDRLTQECSKLQLQVEELANCNQEELREARDRMQKVEEQLAARKQLIKQHQDRLRETSSAISKAREEKNECLNAIKEAQNIREECRGWSRDEVEKLKANVDALEVKHGWTVISASSTTLTMTYRKQLQLYFDVSAFMLDSSTHQKQAQNKPISLTYIADVDEQQPLALTTNKRFFLQLIRAHLQGLDQSQTRVKDVLHFISTGWDKAAAVEAQISSLNRQCLTQVDIIGDDRLVVKAAILLQNIKTKVHVIFGLHAFGNNGEVATSVTPSAEVIYGENFRTEKMQDFLKSKVAHGLSQSYAPWGAIIGEMKQRMSLRASKGR